MNYKKALFLVAVVFISISAHSQVGINTEKPDSSAMLDIVSSDKGILIPRMTSAQRNLIINPVPGLIIYNTDKNCIEQYKNATELWYNSCTRTISGIGLATLNCTGVSINGPILRAGETTPPLYTVSIPYSGGNGGAYSQTMFTSTGVTGLRATIPVGNFSVGSGVLTFYITGIPASGGTATFNISLGSSICSFQIGVKSDVFATNCETQIGLNVPIFPLTTAININGAYVNISRKTSEVPGPIGVDPNGGFCGSTLRNDGSPVRIGRKASANGVNSITLIFSRPVNNVSIVSNWYTTNDAHAVTTNSTGTIRPVNILSSCLANFAITGTDTKRINVRCTNGLNNMGLTYIVNATQPYTEITISVGDTGQDDIIAAFAVCDAYLTY